MLYDPDASYEIRSAQAAALGLERRIKHAGRWCFLMQVKNGKALYFAPQKAQITRAAIHKPIFIEIDLPEIEA
jgi:GH25 family lysozyme M1 (1,4-beta-N-acetylmuramidase)